MSATDTMTPFLAAVPGIRHPESAPDSKWPAMDSVVSAPHRFDDHAELNEAVKLCATSGTESARQFRPAVRPEYVPAIVQGIITHYMDPGLRARLKEPGDNLRLVEDLGLDSLTMMEIMIRVEDFLHVSVSDEELRHFRTLGEVQRLIDRSVRGQPAPVSSPLPAS